jgi:hypothetical protein
LRLVLGLSTPVTSLAPGSQIGRSISESFGVLAFEDVSCRWLKFVGLPQVSGTAVLCPDWLVRRDERLFAKSPGTPCLPFAHHLLRRDSGETDHNMHVIAPSIHAQ